VNPEVINTRNEEEGANSDKTSEKEDPICDAEVVKKVSPALQEF